MSGRGDDGAAANPWVRRPQGDAADEGPPDPGPPPPSPWNHPVEPPGPPATGPAGANPAGANPAGANPAGANPAGASPGVADPVGAASLRRSDPEPTRRMPRFLLPVVVAIALVAVAGIVVLVLPLVRGERRAEPSPSSTGSAPTQSPTGSPGGTPTAGTPGRTYTPPANALPVGGGVSVVPAAGWTLFAAETKGRQLVYPAPGGGYRAWFWVRQRQGISAEDFVVRIVEGEITKGRQPRMSNTTDLPCPHDGLVECRLITYSMEVAPGLRLQGYVEGYRRADGLVTAIDFISRPDFYPRAYADALRMKKSVVDSL